MAVGGKARHPLDFQAESKAPGCLPHSNRLTINSRRVAVNIGAWSYCLLCIASLKISHVIWITAMNPSRWGCRFKVFDVASAKLHSPPLCQSSCHVNLVNLMQYSIEGCLVSTRQRRWWIFQYPL
jgi:hypothetical protein